MSIKFRERDVAVSLCCEIGCTFFCLHCCSSQNLCWIWGRTAKVQILWGECGLFFWNCMLCLIRSSMKSGHQPLHVGVPMPIRIWSTSRQIHEWVTHDSIIKSRSKLRWNTLAVPTMQRFLRRSVVSGLGEPTPQCHTLRAVVHGRGFACHSGRAGWCVVL